MKYTEKASVSIDLPHGLGNNGVFSIFWWYAASIPGMGHYFLYHMQCIYFFI